MDISEVFRRVGLAYWPLIAGLALMGTLGGGALHYGEAPVYTSEVRFVLDVPDPQALAEATAVADTAKSIATSPSHLQAALALAGVKRDVTEFAARNIELQPLGNSGVMDLQVKDTDRKAAAVVANALAADIIDTRAQVERTQAQALLGTLAEEISATDASIAKVDAAIAASPRSGGDPSVLAATLSGLYSERASLAQERLTLEAEQYQVSQYLATRPQAGIIEAAVPAAQADPSRAPIDLALGLIGGLVLGVMLAALLALMRPRIRGLHQIEQALDAPVLGDFDPIDDEVDATIGARIRVAAARGSIKQIQLAALDGSAEARTVIGILASRLETPVTPHGVPVPLNGNGQAIVRPKRKTSAGAPSVTLFDLNDFAKDGNATDVGLVAVTPDVLRSRHIEAAEYLTSVTGRPLVGIVTYNQRALQTIGQHRRQSALIPLTSDRESLDAFSFRAGLK